MPETDINTVRAGIANRHRPVTMTYSKFHDYPVSMIHDNLEDATAGSAGQEAALAAIGYRRAGVADPEGFAAQFAGKPATYEPREYPKMVTGLDGETITVNSADEELKKTGKRSGREQVAEAVAEDSAAAMSDPEFVEFREFQRWRAMQSASAPAVGNLKNKSSGRGGARPGAGRKRKIA
jgi:hypothetical protein